MSAVAAAVMVLQNNGGTNTFSGQIRDASSASAINLVKTGNGEQVLAGVNAFSGPTIISNGTLVVNGTLGTGGVSVVGGILAGDGYIGGPVAIQLSGTLAPGPPIGTLVCSNDLTLAGTTYLKLNGALGTNDSISVGGTLTCGGTLTVTNLGGTLTAGNSFTLFSAANPTGSFSATNLPALTTGLGWNFNTGNGVLSVVQTVATNPPNITYSINASSLTISWPQDHTGWRLQVQTNSLGAGFGTNWATVASSANVNQMLVPLDANLGSVFYRLVFP